MMGFADSSTHPTAAEPFLFERHADSLFPAPDDVAGFRKPVALDSQREPIGKPEHGGDVERGAGIGNIAHRAGNRLAAELNGSGLQDALASGDPVFIHNGTSGGI